jgi:hypothetical protein
MAGFQLVLVFCLLLAGFSLLMKVLLQLKKKKKQKNKIKTKKQKHTNQQRGKIPTQTLLYITINTKAKL